MRSKKVSRRRFVGGTAALSTALVAAPFVRGAYAAGKLSIGFWDHWVPDANKATEKLVKEWADKEKVEVSPPEERVQSLRPERPAHPLRPAPVEPDGDREVGEPDQAVPGGHRGRSRDRRREDVDPDEPDPGENRGHDRSPEREPAGARATG